MVRCCRNPRKWQSKSSTDIHEVEENSITLKTKLLKTVVNINGKEVEMEIDTGVPASVMTHTEYKTLWSPGVDNHYVQQE